MDSVKKQKLASISRRIRCTKDIDRSRRGIDNRVAEIAAAHVERDGISRDISSSGVGL
jgi:hypothetical protein